MWPYGAVPENTGFIANSDERSGHIFAHPDPALPPHGLSISEQMGLLPGSPAAHRNMNRPLTRNEEWEFFTHPNAQVLHLRDITYPSAHDQAARAQDVQPQGMSAAHGGTGLARGLGNDDDGTGRGAVGPLSPGFHLRVGEPRRRRFVALPRPEEHGVGRRDDYAFARRTLPITADCRRQEKMLGKRKRGSLLAQELEKVEAEIMKEEEGKAVQEEEGVMSVNARKRRAEETSDDAEE